MAISITQTSHLRSLAHGSLLAVGLISASAMAVRSEELVVGVRLDTPPFAFYEGADSAQLNPTSTDAGYRLAGRPDENEFGGYVVTVCSRALRTLTERNERPIDVFTRPVNAQNRFDLLEAGYIDVLCDPATVTRDRAMRAIPSLPIYMSAISYARREPLPVLDECTIRVGFVSDTTAPRGVSKILLENTEPAYWRGVGTALQALQNGDRSPFVELSSGEICDGVHVIERYDDHGDLARDFCAGNVMFYVGDVEIVRSMLVGAGCIESSVIAPAVYSNERYAIFFAKPSEPAPSLAILELQMELYKRIVPSAERTRTSMPEERSLLVEAFNGTEGLTTASDVLRTFFWSVTGDFP